MNKLLHTQPGACRTLGPTRAAFQGLTTLPQPKGQEVCLVRGWRRTLMKYDPARNSAATTRPAACHPAHATSRTAAATKTAVPLPMI